MASQHQPITAFLKANDEMKTTKLLPFITSPPSTIAFFISSNKPNLPRQKTASLSHLENDDLSYIDSGTLAFSHHLDFNVCTRRSALATAGSLSSFICNSRLVHPFEDCPNSWIPYSSAIENNDVINIQNNPAPTASLRSLSAGIPSVSMPLIGYSFYKTSPEQAPRGLALALRAGIRHFDMATDYNNFDKVAPLLREHWKHGKIDWNFTDENQDLLQKLDEVKFLAENAHQSRERTKKRTTRDRREETFLTYKISNQEQSTDSLSVRLTIQNLLSHLDTSYLDLVCLHSPLTSPSQRLATYQTLLELKKQGLIHAVGVCNYGICHLNELANHRLPFPSLNQLELSPFNTHEPIVQFCQKNDIAVSCSAWSRLSSVDGPVEQWEKLGSLAKAKGVTKAQILVRWAWQKGYGCAPRSGTGSKLERQAIAENSLGGVIPLQLSQEDITYLDELNVSYKSGTLGRRDGWKEEDMKGPTWDPTESLC